MQILTTALVEKVGIYRVCSGEVMTAAGKTVSCWVADVDGNRISGFGTVEEIRAVADVFDAVPQEGEVRDIRA